MQRYSVRVAWSEEDETFIARCPEFRSVAADGVTYRQAIEEFERVLGQAIELFEEDDRPLPEPRFDPSYSGNLSLRIGSDMHRRVAERAEVEGVSINSLLQTAIAYYLGLQAGRSIAIDADSQPGHPLARRSG